MNQAVEDRSGQDKDIDILALLGVIWRNKLIILTTIVIGLFIGGYKAFVSAVPQYAANTTLAMQLRNEQVVDIETVISGVSTDAASINTELEVLRSRGLLETLVTELNLTEDPEFNASLRPPAAFNLRRSLRNLVDRVLPGSARPANDDAGEPDEIALDNTIIAARRAISATNLPSTYVFRLQATTQNPRKSALIANTLAELYIQDQINVKFQATENAVAWLSERVVELEQDLETKVDAIEQRRAELDVVGPEQLEALRLRVRDLASRLESALSEKEDLQQRLRMLEDLRAQQDRSAIADLAQDPLLDRLLPRLRNDGSPALEQEFDARVEQLIAQRQIVLDRNNDQIVTLEPSLGNAESVLKIQTEQLAQLQQLQREADATRTLYETFLTRLKETSVQRGLQQADSRVLSKATTGVQVAPRRSRILLVWMILGALAGATIAMGRQFMRSGFRSSEELQAVTDIPLLGLLPKFPIRKRGDLLTYLVNNPTSASAEAIRNLRTSILMSNLDNPPQVLMLTSSIPGEGKTTQSIALAHNLAGLGKRVLLIEGDIRRRTFASYLKAPANYDGILAALDETRPLQDSIIHSDEMGIDVMMGAQTPLNAADLFSSEAFRSLLLRLRQEYDHIVIDTPPVLVVSDARVLGRLVDMILIVVAWDKTRRAQLMEALRQFETANLRVNGLIMTQIDPKGMKRYGYDGNYGAYSSYGNSYYLKR
jgi:capsular exopolysaccharide synthesis family protein